MVHHTPLIATIVGSLVLALILGALANRLRISPLVGYLLAGVFAGPFTPGFVADQALVPELAEIGVILLMFGVGLHFSLKDLFAVKRIALPGAILQIGLATLLGLGLSLAMGSSVATGLVFGLALSCASTVVLLRALQERRLIETERGRIAVGWLIMEDLAMVLVLVLLPALAGVLDDTSKSSSLDAADILRILGIALGKVTAFIALMLIVGRRVIPWLLHYIAHTGSRELFRLAVLVIALGVAYGAALLFGVSFALGAFFAGMVLSESDLSHQAAQETLPLRDAFAVLFFVSVGMLFNPSIIVDDPLPLIATFLIIIFGKSLAAFALVRLFGHSSSTALMISASLAQIGEFSFILAALGVELNLLSTEGRDLILASAILSILANPVLFALLDRAQAWIDRREGKEGGPSTPGRVISEEIPTTQLTGHAVVVGSGRVGSLIIARLEQERRPFLVIEDRRELVEQLRARSIEVIAENGANAAALAAANLAGARWLFLAIPNGFEAGQIVEQTRAINSGLEIIARAHSDDEVGYLRKCGADHIIMGEREIARGMLELAFGLPDTSGDGSVPGGITGGTVAATAAT
ncbi:YbaL family putative K(+) efflux transporter [Dongia soli]|uniref:YbaL family putative K(+) efflux transporter n=1 Tax=Dongia soli TaxID=600628 RepID=A0ABU5EEN3_9PROT|nr:YbaL family putative K(+) efflux transporter [Dongia soli]MDY0884304.1 YbaL family putative K(+) efflux transporter [Dongia soli]